MSRRRSARVLTATLVLCLTLQLTTRGQVATGVELVTITPAGVAGGGEDFIDGVNVYGTGQGNISADNRLVVFSSASTTLVAGDANGVQDVFLRDRATGATTLVSLATGGAQGNGASGQPVISADGRYVAFISVATNLVAGDTNQQFDDVGAPYAASGYDIFVRDLQTQTTVRASVGSSGVEAEYGVVNMAPSISADGRYVAFTSQSRNLAPGEIDNFNLDVFVRDLTFETTERVSVRPDGVEIVGADAFMPSISADGGRVVFTVFDNTLAGPTPSVPSNLVRSVYLRDRTFGQTVLVSARPDGTPADYVISDFPMISADGRYVSFASWEDLDPAYPDSAEETLMDGPFADIFVRDLQTGTTRRASLPYPDGAAEESGRISAISRTGRFVAYHNNRDMVVRDMIANTTAVIRPPDGSSPPVYNVTLSQDGRYIFAESFTDLVAQDTNGIIDAYLFSVPAPDGADLSLTLTASTTQPAVGSDVTLTVTVANAGDQTANGITANLALPTGLSYVSDNGSGTFASGTWSIASLAKGATASLQVVAHLDTLLPVTVNAEIMSATPFDPDSTPGNGSAAEDDQKKIILTPQVIDLSLSLTTGTFTPPLNSNLPLTLSLANTGTVGATGVAARLPLPAGLSFVSSNGAGAYDSNTGIWTVGAIAVSASPVLHVVARVTTTAQIDLSAEVTAANETDRDSTPNNNIPTEDDQGFLRLTPVKTDIVVNDTTGIVDPLDGKCTLVEAIIAANTDMPTGSAVGECAGGSGPDMIHLRALTPPYRYAVAHNAQFGPTALPVITTDITIDGGGAAIERDAAIGTPQFRLFVIDSAGRLVLDHVIVRRGIAAGFAGAPFAAFFGGGIYNAGRLELEGSIVANNAAACDGGGIHSLGPLLVRGNSVIESNTTSCSGGGIGAFFAGTVSVTDSIIRNNVAFEGGAGLFIHGTATATLARSRVLDNGAVTDGGGIFTHNADANLTITESEIRGNSAQYGGGISNGRLDADGLILVAGGTMSVGNTTIDSNVASSFGGGIASAGPLTVTGSAISRNKVAGAAVRAGGGIYSIAPLTMTGGYIITNQAFNGAGVCMAGQSLSITGTSISGNTAANAGGGISIGFARTFVVPPAPRALALTDVILEDNVAGGGGGIYSALQTGDVLTVDHAIVRRNSGSSGGGGLLLAGGTQIVRNDSQILDNSGGRYGGGVFVQDFVSGGVRVTIDGGVIAGNDVIGATSPIDSAGGGGIWTSARQGGSLVTLTGVVVSDNRAPLSVGGAILNLGQMAINGSVLSGNLAQNGGALANGTSVDFGGPATISRSFINFNVALMRGGAVHTASPAGGPASDVTTLIETLLDSNRAAIGGGIAVTANTTVDLRRGTSLFNNVATVIGGGVYNVGLLNIEATTIGANRADSGGAIYNTSGVAVIERSTITQNRARVAAGINVATCCVAIYSSTISGNVGTDGGGALDVTNAPSTNPGTFDVRVADSTLVNNVGSSGVVNSAYVYMTGTILAGNRQPGGSFSECLTPSGAVGARWYSFDNLIGQDGGCPLTTLAAAELMGLRTIDQATLFTTVIGPLQANGGPTATHALLPGSLAIDANTVWARAVDQRGLPRVMDGDGDGLVAGDVGAVEEQNVSASPIPVLNTLAPASAASGAALTTITVNGHGFTPGSIALWNGMPRVTFALSSTRLLVTLQPGDVTATEQLATVLVAVRNPVEQVSNPLAFTIRGPNVATLGTAVVPPGSSGGALAAGISATLTNNGAGTPAAVVTVASYAGNPGIGTIFFSHAFYDLQVVGADASDSVIANFYYPFTVSGAAEAALVLRYWTGSAWAPVLLSGGAVPLKDMTDNVDGLLLTGGKFSVTLDGTSTPPITALGGTVFALAEVETRQARLSGSGYNSPETPAYRATFSVDVSDTSSASGAVKYSYARTRMNMVSSSVTSYAVSGSLATIEGAASVNNAAGYTFTATANAAAPNSFALVIRRGDGSVYYSAPALPLAGGGFTLTP